MRRGCRSRHGVVVAASATILGVRARKRRRVARPSSVEKDPRVARSAVGHRRTRGRRPLLDGQKRKRPGRENDVWGPRVRIFFLNPNFWDCYIYVFFVFLLGYLKEVLC